jgi:hypothetical protein
MNTCCSKRVYVSMYAHLHVHMYVCQCMYVICMYLCIYAHLHVHMCAGKKENKVTFNQDNAEAKILITYVCRWWDKYMY